MCSWSVDVYWPEEDEWFPGVVTDCRSGKNKSEFEYLVEYEDGEDIVWEIFSKQNVKFKGKLSESMSRPEEIARADSDDDDSVVHSDADAEEMRALQELRERNEKSRVAFEATIDDANNHVVEEEQLLAQQQQYLHAVGDAPISPASPSPHGAGMDRAQFMQMMQQHTQRVAAGITTSAQAAAPRTPSGKSASGVRPGAGAGLLHGEVGDLHPLSTVLY